MKYWNYIENYMHMIYTHIHRKKLHRFYSKYIYISINTYIFTLPLFTLHLITPPLSPLFFFFFKKGRGFYYTERSLILLWSCGLELSRTVEQSSWHTDREFESASDRHEVDGLSLAICNSRGGWHPRCGPVMARGSQSSIKKKFGVMPVC